VGYGETVPKNRIRLNSPLNIPSSKKADVLTEAYINQLTTEQQKEDAHQINRRTEFKIVAGPTSIYTVT
jgi:peptidoglycan-associated lipoprotein